MNFAPEILFGVGACVLLAAMGYGFWRDSVRYRDKDGAERISQNYRDTASD